MLHCTKPPSVCLARVFPGRFEIRLRRARRPGGVDPPRWTRAPTPRLRLDAGHLLQARWAGGRAAAQRGESAIKPPFRIAGQQCPTAESRRRRPMNVAA